MRRSAPQFHREQVRYWHGTDMLTLLSDVRYRGQSRKHLLAASISPFDPERTSSRPDTNYSDVPFLSGWNPLIPFVLT
jgi:hypothetical protein